MTSAGTIFVLSCVASILILASVLQFRNFGISGKKGYNYVYFWFSYGVKTLNNLEYLNTDISKSKPETITTNF